MNLSIIVPTFNEQDNIQLLVDRIHKSAVEHGLTYEIIFVDDKSSDKTQEIIKTLSNSYPVELHLKQGKKGKAQSLIEGFSYAKYDIICMIDADLQYPPEAIAEMVEKISNGSADVVVAKRKENHATLKRKIISNVYSLFFSKILHGFACDVQSGLKVFRKEIAERLPLNPSPWAFDLEFLVKVRDAGYKIASQDIVFSKRHTGKAKINLLTAPPQLGLASLKLKLLRSIIIPFHPNTVKEKGQGFHYKGKEYVHHSGLDNKQIAFHRLSGMQIIVLLLLAFLLTISFILNWHLTLVFIIALLTLLYFVDLLFNMFLIYRSFSKPAEIQVSQIELDSIQKKDWPSYTILCPLYKEWQVLPQFVTAMSRLEYPKDRLQVMLILEADDTETINHIKRYNLPSYFDTVIVPHSFPKTKPKACNYGLKYATGEYSVIFDAEDVPDILQLKKAILAFKKSDPRTVCVQAKLNFYNPHQNLLTRVFTAEYSLWFDLVLTGLQSIHAPIPLGGTSNHFRTADLHNLKGWDSFNVTEDADLGMRLVKKGYRTAIMDSTTLEEANSGMKNWFGQRTRWIKGYMQTYLLHMRDPREFIQNWTEPHVITFQLVVGGKVLSMFINPLMWVITICYFAFRAHIGTFIESFFPAPILYMGVISLLLGNFLYVYYYMIGCAKHGHHELVKYGILVPFYWLAMSVAAWVALYKLLTDPHYWHKTNHGLHLNKNKVVEQVNEAIGKSLVDNTITNPALVYKKVSGVSIVLPAFNEEDNIRPMVEKVSTFMTTLGVDYEIIIVNDGSRDKTKVIIDRLANDNARVKAVHHSTNYGYGSALRSGFNASTKDWIFFTDSDMQFDISEITKLIDRASDAHMVIGYRKNRQDPPVRILNASIYKTSLKLLFGLNIRDIDCAFKLFSREIIVKNPLKSKGALINAELLIKAKRQKYKTIQVGVSHYPRIKGKATGANINVIFQAMRELTRFKLTGKIA